MVVMCKELDRNLLTSDNAVPGAGVCLQPQMQSIDWLTQGIAHVAHHLISQALHCRRKAKAAGHFRHQLAVMLPARLFDMSKCCYTATDSDCRFRVTRERCNSYHALQANTVQAGRNAMRCYTTHRLGRFGKSGSEV